MSEARGVESIWAALLLTDAGAMNAFDRLWKQLSEGPARGAWLWFSLGLDPFEMPHSVYYGAAVAGVALGAVPAEYRNRAGIRERVEALKAYLERERNGQPLHNRLIVLWASAKAPGFLPAPAQRALIDETLRKQNTDGGWTIEALGPWAEHAAFGWQQQLRYRVGRVRAGGRGSASFRSRTRTCGQMAGGAPEPADWLLGRGLDEQAVSRRLDAEGFMRDTENAFTAMALVQAGDSTTRKR